MPDRSTHRQVGGWVGGTTALALSQGQPLLLTVTEVLGGVLAGQAAGTWPDALEPALSSYHRKEAHAALPALYASQAIFQGVVTVQTGLRSSAMECFAVAASSQNRAQRVANVSLGLLLHLVAGMVPAIPAAYLSHLALDATSSRGVPLVIRGL